jgi:protein-disulfide isomerase
MRSSHAFSALALLATVVLSGFACTSPVASNADANEPRPAATVDELSNVERNVYAVPVDGLPTIGRDGALVTAIVFTDYACPFCQRFASVLADLRAQHGDDVRVAVALRPLPMHTLARPAALAALAAAAQGRFPAMHERLVSLAGKLDEASLVKAAEDAGLDMARFAVDRQSAETLDRLAKSEALAKRFSVQGTPTTFVNGRRVTGAQAEVVKKLTMAELVAAKALVESGADRSTLYAKTIAQGQDHADPDPSISSRTLDPLQRLVLAHAEDLEKCWPPPAAGAPAAPRVTLDLAVRADGTLAHATATPAGDAASCVERVAKGWTFERGKADAIANVGLVRGEALGIELH